MRDTFHEILATLRTNKLRTALTGFAVSWGILIIMVLLGASSGLMNAFTDNSTTQNTNVLTVYPGMTDTSYQAVPKNYWVIFYDKDVRFSENFSDKIDEVYTVRIYSDTISLGQEYNSATVWGCYPQQQDNISGEPIAIAGGRFVNQKDIDEERKVVVVGNKLALQLLGNKTSGIHASIQVGGAKTKRDTHDEISRSAAIIGQTVNIGHFPFRVVGVYEDQDGTYGSNVYIPSTTLTRMRPNQNIDLMNLTFHGLDNEKQNKDFETLYKRGFNHSRGFYPDDNSTLYISNSFTDNIEMAKAKKILTIAFWILGMFTLLSGIVGVSNIMLISVKERTHEFGVRKAIGATPGSLLKLIVTESIAITTFFGIIGIFFGMIANEFMDSTLGSNPIDLGITQIYMFKNIGVGMDVALEALALLIVAGTLAGIIPAWKAARVRPIEALSKS